MSLHWSPLPHLALSGADGATEIALNVTVWFCALGIFGALAWLATLAWMDRAR